jgi:RNA polymerase sigma-70 factor (ECF subfamily)
VSEALPEAGPELALVEAARIHQPGAMERLLARFGGRVYACALRMTADAELAEEITHDVFLSLLRNVAGFRGDASVGTWLYRATLNRCHDHLRRRHRARTEPLEPRHDDIASVQHTDARVQARERADMLSALVAELPAEMREVIVLRFGAGMRYDEIAAVTDSPEGSVASRLHRALRRLGELVKSRGIEPETF